ncbi:DUF2937 family protein [Psychromonas sp.]|uniref:DUF2937 family protein n=1 Tax=Psychromonas sp. TaxID=1884585 RepID=UPI003566F67C
MLLALLQRYSLKLVFALTLLLGLQIPNFLQQYEIRLDSHYIEAKNQLNAYQRLADRYFSGNLQALISTHKNDPKKLFQDEALVVEDLVNRVHYLQTQKDSLNVTLTKRLLFLAGQVNSPLFHETRVNYQAEIILNKNAISVGLVCALISSLLLEFVFFIFAAGLKKFSFPRKSKPAEL